MFWYKLVKVQEEDGTGALETGWGIAETCEKTQGDRDGST